MLTSTDMKLVALDNFNEKNGFGESHVKNLSKTKVICCTCVRKVIFQFSIYEPYGNTQLGRTSLSDDQVDLILKFAGDGLEICSK